MEDPYIGLELLNYKLVEFLDEGTFGRVYRAEHLYLPQKVAIKILRLELASEAIIADFLKEAQDLSRLTHRHIVQVKDCGFFEFKGKKIPYLVMPLTTGSLKEKSSVKSTLDMKTILTYVKGTSQALYYAHHTAKLVHRDIKPANLLLDENGDVLVSDFGLAIVAHSINSLTPQEALGSPAYMAPEQWDGEAIAASDQYALAICVYQWLSGDVPFHNTKELTIRKQHKQSTPPPLARPGSPVSKEIQQVIMKALAKSPKNRFANVLDFATALERAYFVSLPPEPKQPVEPLPKPPQHKNRYRWLLAIISILLIAFLVTGIIFVFNGGMAGGASTSTIVTITPGNLPVIDSFIVTSVTGMPDPQAQQVQARILSYTSPSGSGSANATGSGGANATGTLTFINIGNGVQISGGTLTGASGVPISFGSFFLPFGSVNVQGTAVNQGVSGNIPALDINGSCCGDSNIEVRNPGAFSGGRDPVPNSIITQNDITSATNKLISSLTSAAQTSLQRQARVGEQVVNKSLQCKPNNITADHNVGDQARSVTVKGTVMCTEEVYDQKGALVVATTDLKAEAAKNLGASYALVGNVVTSMTSATVVDAKTVSLVVAAQGVWVYQFTDAILTSIKNKIAKEPESTALADVEKTPGVKSAEIKISSGTTMPDAANITITVVKIPGASGLPTPTSSTIPTSTPTSGLGGGPPTTPTVVLGGS